MTQWVGYDKDCAVVSCGFCVIPAANTCWRHCRLSWHEAALTRHNQKTPMASQSASDYRRWSVPPGGCTDDLSFIYTRQYRTHYGVVIAHFFLVYSSRTWYICNPNSNPFVCSTSHKLPRKSWLEKFVSAICIGKGVTSYFDGYPLPAICVFTAVSSAGFDWSTLLSPARGVRSRLLHGPPPRCLGRGTAWLLQWKLIRFAWMKVKDKCVYSLYWTCY